MKQSLIALLISMLLLIAVSGCQEGDGRAQMIANENLRLELKEKDTKIGELQSLLDKCEDKNKKLTEQSQKSGAGFMEIFAATNEKVVLLEQENAKLKARIKELEKK